MKRNALSSVLIVSLSVALAACNQQSSPALSAQAAGPAQRYVVVFRDATLPADAGARVSKAGGKLMKAIGSAGVATITGTAATRAALEKDSGVLAVGLEHLYAAPTVSEEVKATAADGLYSATAADSLYGYQWDMRRIGAQIGANRVGAAQTKVTVGVLDVGVMSDHPDMVGQIAYSKGTNYCLETGVDGTTGYPVYSKLIDFDAHPDFDPSKDSCTPANAIYEDHGTHVAGTVAGRVGGGEIVGVAPGAKIAAYKVFDRYRYTDAKGNVVDGVGGFDGPIFDAIVDAANRGVNVINMSLGGTLDRSNKDDNASWLAWQRVMTYADKKGTLIIASAGNDAQNSNGTIAHIPSDVPGIMSVSATGVTALKSEAGQLVANGPDVLAFYSNYGASTDIAAPGGDCGTNPANGLSWCDRPSGNRANRPATWFYHLILSSVIDPTTGKPDYAWFAGTSMASPHVAGVAALVKAQHPEFSPNQLKAYLQRTTEKVGQKQTFGAGLLSADLSTR
ncbi:subtilisin family serine protease [Deinococcus metalli]|uniref:Peptidase S8 n=1 Tax=Deinococcus metalli TaxID=1141878 RepID=A0A7W8KC67_9DEIO|nr:S8 family serine peptidase [Deinococcus metalli]MBB5375489.1 subtilisin family serine protease [Deinococcus metalli]GHF28890.1 peptidase S8 [Deinococcus metalli]